MTEDARDRIENARDALNEQLYDAMMFRLRAEIDEEDGDDKLFGKQYWEQEAMIAEVAAEYLRIYDEVVNA